MKTFLVILRTALGILYFLFGVNGFLKFLPSVEFPGIKAEHLYLSFEESDYILPFLYISSLITGSSLLLNLFSALFLLIFLPISIHFSLFYYYLGSQLIFSPEMFTPLLINSIHIILLLSNYRKYSELFKFR